MLGVVLWSDVSDRKAVIWCEDQGDLAYVKPSDEVLRSDDFFDAGDLVQFDMEMSQSTRLAHNARLVVERAGTALPDVLRDAAQEKSTRPRTSGQVVEFSPWSEQPKAACP